MKNLFEKSAAEEVISRFNLLTPETTPLWGKMNAGQMTAHCIASMQTATGAQKPKWMWLGRIIGPLFKTQILNEKPFRRNSPTDPTFIRTGTHDLATERAHLESLIRHFQTAGPAACTDHPHSFFGPLKPEEWARMLYKHLDHHLQQFGA